MKTEGKARVGVTVPGEFEPQAHGGRNVVQLTVSVRRRLGCG